MDPTPDTDTDPAQRAYVFGYGSLVNRSTHAYPQAVRARISGWRRIWRCLGDRGTAFLSVEPAEDTAIDGLVAEVPSPAWAALDAREAGYDRLAVARETLNAAFGDGDVRIYSIPAASATAERRPILLSYLDVVVQGYLREYGPEGVARFFATTVNWDVGLTDDRDAPRYPRARQLTPAERATVDRHLEGLV